MSREFKIEKWKFDLVLQYFEQGGGNDRSLGDAVDSNNVVVSNQDCSCGSGQEQRISGATTSQQKTPQIERKGRRTGGKLLENLPYEHLSGDHGRSCVSLVLKMGSSLEENQTGLLERLARLEGIVAKTNIRWSHRSRLGHQVRQVRLDLAFWSSSEARTFYKVVMNDFELSNGRRLVTGLLLTEADMGYELEPVLSEEDLLFIQSSDYCSNIFRTGVDCWVELDESEAVQYRFPSVTDLNLFLFNKSGRTDTRALGSLRNNRMVMQLLPDQEGFFRLQTSEISLAPDFPTSDKLQIDPHFEMKSLKGNFLKFSSKLDLFKFLVSEYAGKLKHLKFDESKIVENKVLTEKIESERLVKNEEMFKEILFKKEKKINQLIEALELKSVDIENVKKEKAKAVLQLEEALESLDQINELSSSIIPESERTEDSIECEDQ